MRNIVIPEQDIRRLSFFLAMEEHVAGKIEGDAFFCVAVGADRYHRT